MRHFTCEEQPRYAGDRLNFRNALCLSNALVAINDLGPGGETWTLATVTYANKRLHAHTMREIVCIEADPKSNNE